MLPCDIGGAALLGEGEMLDHGISGTGSILFLDGLEDAAVVAEEQVVIFSGQINRHQTLC